MRRALRLVLPAGLALAAIASPRAQTPSVPATSQTDLQRAFDGAIAKWHAKKPAEYEFTVHAVCFCVGVGVDVPFHVTNGESKPTVALAPSVAKGNSYYDTIDKIFAVLQRNISMGPYRMDVEYDQTFGYPTTAEMDPRQYISDDELGLVVSHFKVLK